MYIQPTFGYRQLLESILFRLFLFNVVNVYSRPSDERPFFYHRYITTLVLMLFHIKMRWVIRLLTIIDCCLEALNWICLRWRVFSGRMTIGFALRITSCLLTYKVVVSLAIKTKINRVCTYYLWMKISKTIDE